MLFTSVSGRHAVVVDDELEDDKTDELTDDAELDDDETELDDDELFEELDELLTEDDELDDGLPPLTTSVSSQAVRPPMMRA